MSMADKGFTIDGGILPPPQNSFTFRAQTNGKGIKVTDFI